MGGGCSYMEKMKVQKFLHFRDMSQGDLARAAGLSEGHFSEICRGKKKLSLEKVVEIADVLGTTIEAVALAFNEVRKSYEKEDRNDR